MRHLKVSSIYQLHDMSFWNTKEMYRVSGYSTTQYALNHSNVQKLLYADDKHYDLILVEQFYQDAFLMFAHKFQAPIISICMSYTFLVFSIVNCHIFAATFGWNTYFDSMLDSFGAWAHVPHELLVVPENMNFWQRMKNVYFCLLDKYARHYVYMPEQQVLADKYFAHLPGKDNFTNLLLKLSVYFIGPHPSLEELSRSVSVILQNTHTPMVVVKPNVPRIVDVGGIHIRPPKPLPSDIKQFLDEAKHGVIYFCLGILMTLFE